jgi:hypothetical protein
MQRPYAALHVTLGSYLCDDEQEGSVDAPWHAFMFLEHGLFPPFFFLLGGLRYFFF